MTKTCSEIKDTVAPRATGIENQTLSRFCIVRFPQEMDGRRVLAEVIRVHDLVSPSMQDRGRDQIASSTIEGGGGAVSQVLECWGARRDVIKQESTSPAALAVCTERSARLGDERQPSAPTVGRC